MQQHGSCVQMPSLGPKASTTQRKNFRNTIPKKRQKPVEGPVESIKNNVHYPLK